MWRPEALVYVIHRPSSVGNEPGGEAASEVAKELFAKELFAREDGSASCLREDGSASCLREAASAVSVKTEVPASVPAMHRTNYAINFKL